MKKIVVAIMGTISGLVMLFSYHTSTQGVAAASPEDTDPGNTQSDSDATPVPGATVSAGPAASSSATPAASTTTGSAAGNDGTYTGDAVDTRWGTVQVEITVANGKITSSDAVQYPTGNGRDRQINSYAVPVLNAEVVTAQSASIDAVSGATVTSDGYLQSLQSAIDAAHLG